MFDRFLFEPLGAAKSAPFGKPPKPIIPGLIGASIIGAGASLLGGVGSALSSSSVNRQNIALARENRDWQSAENAKSRQWEEMMWNKNNLYNTPSAMMERYKQAGLNPFLVGGNAGSVGQSVLPSSPSLASSPSMPSLQAPNYNFLGDSMNQYFNTMRLANETKAVDANAANQNAQMAKTLVDGYVTAYKEGGKTAANKFLETFAPFLNGSDPQESEAIKMLQSQRYNIDMHSLCQDLDYTLNRQFSPRERSERINNLVASTGNLVQDTALKFQQGEFSKENMKVFASQIAKNFAEAFSAKKVGEYYEVSAEQLGIMNKMLNLEYENAAADFAFNTGVRKYKKDITHRDTALGLFLGGIGAQSTSQSLQGNKFLQYGKAVTSMVGDLFKVNFGVSSTNTHFMNHTPQKSGQMFYSGDGYFMNNGILQKGNW